MSFFYTQNAILDKYKFVTRRLGKSWIKLKPGDFIQPVMKCQGLKKGEHSVKLGYPVEIVSVKREKLTDITEADIIKEGFLTMSRGGFIAMFLKMHKIPPVEFSEVWVTRIEFKYTN